MAKRNVWEYEETKEMLHIMEEQNCLRLFDGKLYKNVEVYRKVEKELRKRGFQNKNEKQIETRWKNLKKRYMEVKKMNSRSGSDRKLCPFYEELDRMLRCRPSVITSQFGIDTSREETENLPDENTPPILPDEISASPSPSPSPSTSRAAPSTSRAAMEGDRRKENRATGKGSYAKAIEKLGITMKKTQQELNKEFFDNQKKLIDHEFERYIKTEEEFEKRFNETTKSILQENTNTFLAGIEALLQKDGSSTSHRAKEIMEYINSFEIDE